MTADTTGDRLTAPTPQDESGVYLVVEDPDRPGWRRVEATTYSALEAIPTTGQVFSPAPNEANSLAARARAEAYAKRLNEEADIVARNAPIKAEAELSAAEYEVVRAAAKRPPPILKATTPKPPKRRGKEPSTAPKRIRRPTAAHITAELRGATVTLSVHSLDLVKLASTPNDWEWLYQLLDHFANREAGVSHGRVTP